MYPYDFIKQEVEQLLDNKRFVHSLNVENKAVTLGLKYNLDIEKCRIAAIAHDCTKNLSDEELIKSAGAYNIKIDKIQFNFPQLLHGPVAAMYCKEEFGVDDIDIFNAIYYHTTGRNDMSLLEKIIYLADMIECGRDFTGVNDIRKASLEDLDSALRLSCNSTLLYLISNNFLIHPLTIEFRNSLLLAEDEEKKKQF